MIFVGRLLGNSILFAFFFSFMSGISFASQVSGSLQVFFLTEMTSRSLADGTTSFCVAKQNADPTALQLGIDWACGPGLANCGPIQPGQPCYVANNLVAIASYAYNSYYQANQARGGTCFFNNTAMLTNIDPSNGSCIFPGSSGTGTNPGSGSNSSGSAGSPGGSTFAPPLSPFQPTINDNGVSKLQAVKLVYLSPLVLLSLFNC
ncbi:hypothetical protein HPP92_007941 [Vanilla planifolia]|uniref:X8 domain-containing protein n=1 Tax=Vanilla planifolia TaxID=51239 RepID=A0A835V9W1_VANPL|nr:hypothetical protein HPP92_007941 [Vanilla planifolia]